MKLYFKDLPCYSSLTQEQKQNNLYKPENAFDLSRLPVTDIRIDFAAYIYDRTSRLSFLSLRSEQVNFHKLADFLNETYPDLEHLTDRPLAELEKRLKAYLFINHNKLTYQKHKPDVGKCYSMEPPVFSYLRKAYDYFQPHEEECFDIEQDIWKIKNIPFPIRESPARDITRLNFTKIIQEPLKREVKEAALYRLKRLSVSTVKIDITAANSLSVFLDRNFPELLSLKDFDREHLEEYLSYLYLEDDNRTDRRSELACLKSLFTTIGKLYSYDNLHGIFLKSDFPKHKRAIYKCYSDEELKRLHEGYKILDKQTARALLIHELLGLRISDTLTIKKEDVFYDKDPPYIRINQPKTGNSYEKKINNEIVSLLKASLEETSREYGNCEYIFVSDKDPTKPLPYCTLAYRFRVMVRKLNLLDDNGVLFTVGTHLFRHTYGKKLCDLFMDDATIAALLGHRSISSVANYRQMSPKTLAESTKPVIDKRNEKIKKYKKGWME